MFCDEMLLWQQLLRRPEGTKQSVLCLYSVHAWYVRKQLRAEVCVHGGRGMLPRDGRVRLPAWLQGSDMWQK